MQAHTGRTLLGLIHARPATRERPSMSACLCEEPQHAIGSWRRAQENTSELGQLAGESDNHTGIAAVSQGSLHRANIVCSRCRSLHLVRGPRAHDVYSLLPRVGKGRACTAPPSSAGQGKPLSPGVAKVCRASAGVQVGALDLISVASRRRVESKGLQPFSRPHYPPGPVGRQPLLASKSTFLKLLLR